MYSDRFFYIDFSWENYAHNPKEGLISLLKLARLTYAHKVQVFHNVQQLREFSSHLGDLHENFTESFSNIIESILENSTGTEIKGQAFDVIHGENSATFTELDNKVIRSLHDKAYTAILTHSDFGNDREVLIVTLNHLYVVKLRPKRDTESIVTFFAFTDTNRQFHLSPKHGENGKGNHKSASKLLCSASEAQTLLYGAIPDFNRFEHKLFNYDIEKGRYIEFYFEGISPNPKWHGFHLDDSPSSIARIPNIVQKYFSEKYNL